MGWWPGPHCCFGQGLLVAAKHQDYLPAILFTEYHHSDFFLFHRGDVRAGRPLTVPGQPQDEFRGGGPNYLQKTSLLLPFGSRWTMAKSRSESARTGPKKSRNKRVWKMICTEVIMSCAWTVYISFYQNFLLIDWKLVLCIDESK